MRAAAFIVLLILATSLPAADLSTIDRSIAKESAYRGKPTYCLLVFGEKLSKVWLIEDGDRLYVDRNANGDLSEAGEMIEPSKREEFNTVDNGNQVPYRSLVYKIGSLIPVDGSPTHTEFELRRSTIGNAPANHVVHLKVDGKIQQYAGWNTMLAESREKAPVIHFGGPLIARAVRYHEISLSSKKPELHLCFGTPGVGEGSFAFLGYEAVPTAILPVAEIQWPGEGPGLLTKVPMTSRC